MLLLKLYYFYIFFFFNDTATTEIYTLSLHDALPIWLDHDGNTAGSVSSWFSVVPSRSEEHTSELQSHLNLVCRLLLEKKKNDAVVDASGHLNILLRLELVTTKLFDRTVALVPRGLVIGYGRALLNDLYPFFFNDTATTEIYTLSLHDALPIHLDGATPHTSMYVERPIPRSLPRFF